MAKTTFLNLEITTDDNTQFEVWRKSQNGDNNSNALIIDEFAGTLAGGLPGQRLIKKSNGNYDYEWVTPPKIAFTIASNQTWDDLTGSNPYKYQTSITIDNAAIGDEDVLGLFNDVVTISANGIVLAAANDSGDDLILTFYAATIPAVEITGKVVVI